MRTEFQPCEQDTAKTEKTTTIEIDVSTFPSQAVFADDSDFEIADQFIVTQGRNWRYVAKWNKWLYWDGRWVIAEKLEHMTVINTIVAEASRQSDKNLKSAAKSHAVCTVAMSRQEIAAYPDEFDANQWLLGCNTTSQ